MRIQKYGTEKVGNEERCIRRAAGGNGLVRGGAGPPDPTFFITYVPFSGVQLEIRDFVVGEHGE
jgi:hypothetical protein